MGKMSKRGNKCAVLGCENSGSNSTVTFFNFPKNDEQREKWIEYAGLTELLGTDYSRSRSKVLCELHFEDEMYVISNMRIKRKLIRGALPTVQDWSENKGISQRDNEEVEENYKLITPTRVYQRKLNNSDETSTIEICSCSSGQTTLRNLQISPIDIPSISVRSVRNIIRESKEGNALQQPKVYRRKRAILDNISDETKSKIRRVVHSFYERNEAPSVTKILAAIHKDEEMLIFKRTTMSVLLSEMGFRILNRPENAGELSTSTKSPEQIKNQASTSSSVNQPSTESVPQETVIEQGRIKEELIDSDPNDYRLYEELRDSIKTEPVNSNSAPTNSDTGVNIDSVFIKDEPIVDIKKECSDSSENLISIYDDIEETEQIPMFESVFVKEEPLDDDLPS